MVMPPHQGGQRRIAVFTGSRADYGILAPLVAELKARDLDIRLLVSGTHLSRTGGETWRDIKADGHAIDAGAEIVLDADTPTAICTAMGLGLLRFGDALARIAPDMLVVLGDRYEALAAATAAFVSRIPVAHLHGGEQTLGALDEGFRHALTKLSHVHFTSTADYRRRVIQLGEQPDRVHDVGALGVDNALSLPLFDRALVETRLGLAPGDRYILLTFHPATLELADPDDQLAELVAALDRFPDLTKVFTGANADLGGGSLNGKLLQLTQTSAGQYRFFASLGTQLYLSAARWAEAVAGNSSSAVIEVPSLGVPTLDIGERQRGRVRASGVVWCAPERRDIEKGLIKVLSPEGRAAAQEAVNPYFKPGTACIIADHLAQIPLEGLLNKVFYDLPLRMSGPMD